MEEFRRPELRTVIGNLIDDRLALGLARDFIGRIERGAEEASRDRDPRLHVKSLRDRTDALIRIKSSLGPLMIGMRSSKNRKEAVMASYGPFSSGGGPVDTVAVRLDRIDLGRPGSRGPHHKEYWPIHSSDVCAMIRIHTIARYIQRTGGREPEELLPVLKRAGAWSMIAKAFDVPGSWMLPVENGLICATGGIWSQKQGGEERRVPFIRTFIARGNFRPRNAQIWDRLVSAGALEKTPSLLSENTDPDLFRLWELMWKEGREWDRMRAHAIRVRDGNGHDLPVPDHGRDPDLEEMDGPEPV